ncbi:protein kinase C-binding protein NELL2 isoform X2 [Tachysurus fulvidraco]|uniref:protein kinase C-binding protein NELL2 isoform X2 n=1 Tax=Tachysurus fulvidraco TaxID=1234273 RepID=UPI001FEDCDBD|nr:protein kinase C-binding protein NELL2 isoform X2 [Tachysurus fulvidraco]
MALLQFSFALFVLSVCAVELQPALHVDILKELNVGESFTGVSPVQGFHNNTTAFLFKACPTCNDFHGLVQKIMELQDILAKTSGKLAHAEKRMKTLEGCYCEKTCTLNGEIYRDEDVWIDGCKNCTCLNGSVECESIFCPAPQCPPDTAPAYIPGACCKECQPVCVFRERVYVEGERKSAHDSTGNCLLYECRDRKMRKVESKTCPELNCPESEQITLTDRCCKVCQGHDFCADGYSSSCVENSECVNLEAGACCSCRDGYRAVRDDSAYCQDIDECAEGKHYCRENTMCVNTPGSFVCACDEGYLRIDDYSCTEHNECISGLHSCDENALCFNTVGGHSCTCKPGYLGNGTICRAQCDGLCHNGGSCVAPDTCICQQGFTGKRCETDIDECETGRHSCANDTVCFNMDGGYDCRCPHGKNCTGDCFHDGKVKHNRQIWVLDEDRCAVCSCQSGLVMCRRMVCDCENPTVDVSCCPECDPRLSSQCRLYSGLLTYNSGDTWVDKCQQCQCIHGEVDCWPMPCAPLTDCEFVAVPEGECCPRCISDPCQADTLLNDFTKTCVDEYGITRLSGSTWNKHATECSICQCKNGHVCCSVDPLCL